MYRLPNYIENARIDRLRSAALRVNQTRLQDVIVPPDKKGKNIDHESRE